MENATASAQKADPGYFTFQSPGHRILPRNLILNKTLSSINQYPPIFP